MTTDDYNRSSFSVVSAPRQAEGGAGPRRSLSLAARPSARLQDVLPQAPPPSLGGAGGPAVLDADATSRSLRSDADGPGPYKQALLMAGCRGSVSTVSCVWCDPDLDVAQGLGQDEMECVEGQ